MFKNTDGVNHSYHPNIITLALIRLAVKTQPTGEETVYRQCSILWVEHPEQIETR